MRNEVEKRTDNVERIREIHARHMTVYSSSLSYFPCSFPFNSLSLSGSLSLQPSRHEEARGICKPPQCPSTWPPAPPSSPRSMRARCFSMARTRAYCVKGVPRAEVSVRSVIMAGHPDAESGMVLELAPSAARLRLARWFLYAPVKTSNLPLSGGEDTPRSRLENPCTP